VDGDPLTVTFVDDATGGTAVVDAGDVTFTPDADLCGIGAGSFDYTISDGGGGSATGHVTVDLACVNDEPVATDDTVSLDEDVAGDLTGAILGNDADAEGDALAARSATPPAAASCSRAPDPHAWRRPVRVGRRPIRVTDGQRYFDTGHMTVDLVSTTTVATTRRLRHRGRRFADGGDLRPTTTTSTATR
jgi:hypothetical protein